MTYIEKIEQIISKISTTIVDFSAERKRGTAPTQVSSEFLTNKEQGDWAEKTVLNGINNYSQKYVAVKYGRDDDIVAGEDNFKEFYEEYQDELDDIGKRPDILIFNKNDFPYTTYNISRFERSELDKIVPLAKCGIEVRSSAFLFDKYEAFMSEKHERLVKSILEIKSTIIHSHGELLYNKDKALYTLINSINAENLHVISFRCPSWKSNEQLLELSQLLKQLKSDLTEISKRTFLSITPKVEDLKVVYNWVKKYNVPHFYIQVFFDKAYGISFEKILNLISDPQLEGVDYFVESDVKNQNKTTIKIHANTEENVLEKVSLPEHYSQMKELGRGRLLFFVKFKDSMSSLNVQAFKSLLGIDL
ncbi:MAG: AccI family restriction endonuclease [Ruminococcaceae bacterium]|nr:AccI family restriction endonuclease [Oscillospiraceae bacterium]